MFEPESRKFDRQWWLEFGQEYPFSWHALAAFGALMVRRGLHLNWWWTFGFAFFVGCVIHTHLAVPDSSFVVGRGFVSALGICAATFLLLLLIDGNWVGLLKVAVGVGGVVLFGMTIGKWIADR